MLDKYTFFNNLFGGDYNLGSLVHEFSHGSEDSIINYEAGALYELLMDHNVRISAINQIMKLHSTGYPLTIYEAINLSTDDLRSIVKNQELLSAI